MKAWVQYRSIALGACIASFAPASAEAARLSYLKGFGDKASAVAPLTWGVLIVSLVVIVIIASLVAWAAWRKGEAPPEPGAKWAITRPAGGLRWIWIGAGLSSIVLVASVVWTMEVLARIEKPASSPGLVIEVTGHQWWWQVRYLSDDPSRIFATANEIHIPTGTPVRFKLISNDVIHSFWVPALSGKTDMIPGTTNETWLDAREPGTYYGECSEYCGLEHAEMRLIVVAQTPDEFRAWWDHQLENTQNPEDISAGEAAFNTHCGACHAVRGSDAAGALGPDLSHLMTRTTIAAGLMANTPQNLAHWISDPQDVKPGSFMQRPELTPTELADVGAYLQRLR